MTDADFLSPGAGKERIAAAVEEIKPELVSFVQTLVRTPSLPGEEKAVQDIVASKLKELNMEVDTFPINVEDLAPYAVFSDDGIPVEKRLNIVGRWKGVNPSSRHPDNYNSLILNGHVDVVSPGKESLWEESPWSGSVKDGRIYGRGSTDMKAGLSSAVFACEALRNIGFRPYKDVLLQSVVGEETGGCGTLSAILRGYTADAAVIMEPTGLKIYPVQSGTLWFRLKVKGKSIHACIKNSGISAVEKFYTIFHAINEFDRRRHADFADFSSPMYDNPMNVAPISFGSIKSGDWPSTVPDLLVAEGRCGVFPGESVEDARQAFEETVKAACSDDRWLKANVPEIEWIDAQFEPGVTGMDEPVIKTLSACHEAVLSEETRFAGATYGSDLPLFTNHANIPAVLYGPGHVNDAHAVNESISIDEIINATKVLAFFILNWCGGGIPVKKGGNSNVH